MGSLYRAICTDEIKQRLKKSINQALNCLRIFHKRLRKRTSNTTELRPINNNSVAVQLSSKVKNGAKQ